MTDYKSVRLEEHVYEELLRRMKPRESMSQTVERLLDTLDKIAAYAWAIGEISEGGEQWNTKR